MFEYHATKEMKKFLDKITDCKTKEDQQMLDQIKHYLDWPLQLYALQEAEFQLRSCLEKKEQVLLTEDVICQLAEELYEGPMEDGEEFEQVTKKFLDETDIMPKDSPFNKENVKFECDFSFYDPAPMFFVEIDEGTMEIGTDFTCTPNQELLPCLRELYCLVEDYWKGKNVTKVVYKATDPNHKPETSAEYLMKIREKNEQVAEYSLEDPEMMYASLPYYCLIKKDSKDIIAALRKTLQRILEDGGDKTRIQDILGGVLLSEIPKDDLTFAKDECVFIDLGHGYGIIGDINHFARL